MSAHQTIAGDAASEGDRERLTRVAWMYYRDNLTQAEIAAKLYVSRPTVARLLERARSTGVVTIDIKTAGFGGDALISAVQERYELSELVIVPQSEGGDPTLAANTQVASEGGQYLRRFLTPGAVIGMGFGDTVLRSLLSVRRPSWDGVTLATLTGGVEGYVRSVESRAVSGIAEYTRFLPAPLLASTLEIAEALRTDTSVIEVLDLARSATATMIGIGPMTRDARILRDRLISVEHFEEYRRRGAVGDIIGTFYDAHGKPVDTEHQNRRIGLDIAELRNMSNVIAVAGGVDKTEAIRGALAGKYIDVLITTEDVARNLIPPS